MDKILAEYRKKIGDFEVVEVDEARIEALRNQLDVDVKRLWRRLRHKRFLAPLLTKSKPRTTVVPPHFQ